MLFFLKVPSGDGVGEIFCMLVLGESDLRLDAKDAATRGRQKRFDITAVFLIVNFGQLLPNGAVGDFFRGAFEDYGFVGFVRSDDDTRHGCDVFRFARAGATTHLDRPTRAPA